MTTKKIEETDIKTLYNKQHALLEHASNKKVIQDIQAKMMDEPEEFYVIKETLDSLDDYSFILDLETEDKLIKQLKETINTALEEVVQKINETIMEQITDIKKQYEDLTQI